MCHPSPVELQASSNADYRNEKLPLNEELFLSEVDENHEDWVAMGRLRSEVYVYNCHFLEEDVIDENGAEFDEYDKYSKHFIAKNEHGDVVGTIRVVSRDSQELLPAERLFKQDVPEAAYEVSRIMVNPNLSTLEKPLVSVLLMNAAIRDMTATEDLACAVVESKFRRYLSGVIGVVTKEVAPLRMIEEYKSENLLITFNPRLIASQVRERDSRPRMKAFPEKLAPLFEYNAETRGLGRVALRDLME